MLDFLTAARGDGLALAFVFVLGTHFLLNFPLPTAQASTGFRSSRWYA